MYPSVRQCGPRARITHNDFLLTLYITGSVSAPGKCGTRKSGPHWPERRSRQLKQSISGGETPNRLLPTALTDASFFFAPLYLCLSPTFHRNSEISCQDRLETTIATSAGPLHPRFCPSSCAFPFSKVDRCRHRIA